jgi:hypothetical protein
MHCTDGYCCGDATCGPGATCGYFGKEGTCVKTGGTACTADDQCGSGHCVDGVCCDTACDGQCEACDVPDSTTGRPGKCIPVKGSVHGKRAACASGGGDVCAAAACDGSDTSKCAAFTGSETTCRPQSCTDGVLTAPAVCNGKGGCPDLVTSKCDGFVCTADGKACETTCTDDSKCITGYVCGDGGKCKPKTAKCSDDLTTSTSSDGTVQICAPFKCGTDGTCAKQCATAEDCAQGASCDSASQQCVAPPTVGPDQSSGCGCTTPGSGGEPGAALASIAGLLFTASVVRRRRGRLSGWFGSRARMGGHRGGDAPASSLHRSEASESESEPLPDTLRSPVPPIRQPHPESSSSSTSEHDDVSRLPR